MTCLKHIVFTSFLAMFFMVSCGDDKNTTSKTDAGVTPYQDGIITGTDGAGMDWGLLSDASNPLPGQGACKLVLQETKVTDTCKSTLGNGSFTLSSSKRVVGFFDPTTSQSYYSQCADCMECKNCATAGKFQLALFNKFQKAEWDVCIKTGAEQLTGIGDKACVYKKADSTNYQLGLSIRDTYFYLGSCDKGVTYSGCTKEELIELAKAIAATY